jgi:hypothetical protein
MRKTNVEETNHIHNNTKKDFTMEMNLENEKEMVFG